MLDLFTIFSRGGIVLWCFQGTSQIFTPSVNALIRSVILQVNIHRSSFLDFEVRKKNLGNLGFGKCGDTCLPFFF